MFARGIADDFPVRASECKRALLSFELQSGSKTIRKSMRADSVSPRGACAARFARRQSAIAIAALGSTCSFGRACLDSWPECSVVFA